MGTRSIAMGTGKDFPFGGPLFAYKGGNVAKIYVTRQLILSVITSHRTCLHIDDYEMEGALCGKTLKPEISSG
jgi:hypothetical protein